MKEQDLTNASVTILLEIDGEPKRERNGDMNTQEKLKVIEDKVEVLKKVYELNPVLLSEDERFLIAYVKILELKIESHEDLIEINKTILEAMESEVIALREELRK